MVNRKKKGPKPNSLVIKKGRVFQQTLKAQKDVFVNTLKSVHNVRVACEIMGISRTQVYQWRNDDDEFAKRWDEAIEYSKEALESAAYLKLQKSYNDKRRKLSMPDVRLTEFLLSGMFPEKYRQRIEMESRQLNITINWANVPQAALDEYLAKKITLQDVYEISLQQTPRDTRMGEGSEGSGSEGSGEKSTNELLDPSE